MAQGTLLLVDDSLITLKAWSALFAGAGYTVVTAQSGEEALAQFVDIAPDLVATDILMPGMDGYELCRRIRARPDGRAVAILAITSAPALEAKLHGFEAGVDDFVGKDTAPAELLARVQALVARQRLVSTSLSPPEAAAAGTRQVVVCLSLKGGAGTSTLAANLALLLAQQGREQVALLDLALQTGATEVLLDVVPRVDLGTLARDEADVAGLSRSDVRRLVAMHPAGVALLAAPRLPEDAERVTPELVAAALEALAHTFGCVVVDTPAGFTEHALRALDMADLVVVVATPDVVGAKSAVAALHVLDALEFPRDRVVVVLNAPYGNGEVDPQQLASLLGLPVTVQVPYDPAFGRALNTGQPRALEAERHRTAALAALHELAKQVDRRLTGMGHRQGL
jgi:pilus assembly protein CpaE